MNELEKSIPDFKKSIMKGQYMIQQFGFPACTFEHIVIGNLQRLTAFIMDAIDQKVFEPTAIALSP
jgi:hypothetical protein